MICKNHLAKSNKRLLLLTNKVNKCKSKTKHSKLRRNKFNKKWPCYKSTLRRKPNKKMIKLKSKNNN